MQLVGRDSVMALDETPGSAGVAPPVGLDNAGSIEQTAIASTDAPHADPGLQLDRCPLLPCKGLQCCTPPLLHQLCQDLLPPALNDQCSDYCMQQCPAHQGAPPPGLDLYDFWIAGRGLMLISWGLARKKRGLSETVPHPLESWGMPERDPDSLSTISPSAGAQEH